MKHELMNEYISREKLPKRKEYWDDDFGAGWDACLDAIDEIPAADVRENKRGEWKRVVDFTGVEAFGYKETMLVGYGCNVCGYEVDVSEGDYNFCPNCGADMRGAE